ncbi:rod shape-determining protein [bacterium]|nr:rod shape-determining protein [bacterium]
MFSLTPEFGIDLGTYSTIVYCRGKGIIMREPSVVAKNIITGEVLAIGEEAYIMLGRTPDYITAGRPVMGGVIGDYTTTQRMLYLLLKKLKGYRSFFKPRVVISVHTGATGVERRAVIDACKEAGAGEVYPVDEIIAASLGAGLPIDTPTGNMVVDIGGGTTSIGVVSLWGIVVRSSVRQAGLDMDEAIIRYLRRKSNLMIGERSAEEIKIKIGSLDKYENDPPQIEVRGRDLLTGLPRTITVDANEIREALLEVVQVIEDKIKEVLEHTPPELAADIAERGITLTGGGSLLRGLASHLSESIGIPFKLVEDPVSCVALGTGRILENLKEYRKKGYIKEE